VTRLFLAAYAAALALLLPRLSLWLDEILTLAGARQPDLPALLEYLRTVPGGTLLAFLAPQAAIRMLGYSVFSARAVSALASVAACAGVLALARQMKLRWPLAAVAVFALCPLQFRYALEARPYALALCLSVWSTVVVLKLAERPRWRAGAAAYALLTLAAGYTLAYALFVPAAHLAWLTLARNRAAALPVAASLAAAGAALAPWYLHFRADWQAITATNAPWDWGAIGVFLKELTGAGYWGTALVACGACFGAKRTGWRSPWLWWAVVPVPLVWIANAVFNYFFAVRQMIYILAPLALLFAAGVESLRGKGRALLALFLVASLYEDVNWFRKPREDWEAAAWAIPEQGCVMFVPADAQLLYTFFRPELAARKCAAADPAPVVLAASPYDPGGEREAARRALAGRGLVRASAQTFQGPEVQVWAPPGADR
jgi:hypothetical protein